MKLKTVTFLLMLSLSVLWGDVVNVNNVYDELAKVLVSLSDALSVNMDRPYEINPASDEALKRLSDISGKHLLRLYKVCDGVDYFPVGRSFLSVKMIEKMNSDNETQVDFVDNHELRVNPENLVLFGSDGVDYFVHRFNGKVYVDYEGEDHQIFNSVEDFLVECVKSAISFEKEFRAGELE